MSIYKSQRVYGRTFWRALRGLILRKRCDSYLDARPGYCDVRIVCEHKMGHNSRHENKFQRMTWGIGDNLV